ncbi:hypothetical protein C5167_003849 [Papaver somniferum]|uniref:Uncharacterized protein n=1 Tax=Papaver somniferum TaxID=3469 RepID=A0A4Y7L227_PAPSO|nr:hypothetical protein C5167_003849 [Papaver somniferum]
MGPKGGFFGSRTALVMPAFDDGHDAIGYGVDTLSLSLAASAFIRLGFSSDLIENDRPTYPESPYSSTRRCSSQGGRRKMSFFKEMMV